jgi:microcystin degradation protein MlrC
MRVYTALFGTETNSFSPIPTGVRDFEDFLLVRGGTADSPRDTYTATLQLWREKARARNWELFEGLCAFAYPSGLLVRAAYEALRDEILREIERVLPLDLVLLNLHGAMMAEGYDDCEGDLLTRVRALVGRKCVVGVELDCHCHLSQAMLANSDVIVAYKEFPHSDFAERADDLFRISAAALAGTVKPVIGVFDCRMIGFYPTTREPMRSFVDRMSALEGKDGILSVSLGHGYPWADLPDMGSKMIVVADGDRAKAEALARRLGEEFFALRGETVPPFIGIPQAFSEAAKYAGKGKPVILTDVADGPSGGSPGDSTFLLTELLRRGVRNAALAILWDPVAVQHAFRAGEGAQIRLRLGGKTGEVSGPPIDLEGQVLRLVRDATETINGAPTCFGDACALRTGGVEIVIGSKRLSVIGRDCFTNLGIDPTRKELLVVKGQHGFYNDFAPIAERVLYVGTPGACQPLFPEIPFRRLRRPIWPLDPSPFG